MQRCSVSRYVNKRTVNRATANVMKILCIDCPFKSVRGNGGALRPQTAPGGFWGLAAGIERWNPLTFPKVTCFLLYLNSCLNRLWNTSELPHENWVVLGELPQCLEKSTGEADHLACWKKRRSSLCECMRIAAGPLSCAVLGQQKPREVWGMSPAHTLNLVWKEKSVQKVVWADWQTRYPYPGSPETDFIPKISSGDEFHCKWWFNKRVSPAGLP